MRLSLKTRSRMSHVSSNKEGESLIIKTPDGQEIKITLTRYRNVQTEVGIEAPKDYVIVREENASIMEYE